MRSFALLLTIVALFVVGGWIAREKLSDGENGDVASLGAMIPSGTPPELRSVFDSIDGARANALPGFLGGGGGDGGGGAEMPASATPDPPFADAGSERAITRVRRAVRRTLRRADDRARVVAWQGVIVAGERAVVRADVERLVRMTSGKRVARPPERVTLGLRRAGGGWQVATARR